MRCELLEITTGHYFSHDSYLCKEFQNVFNQRKKKINETDSTKYLYFDRLKFQSNRK